MIGPPTAQERIKALEGRLADVAMQAQQLHLQYGGDRRGELVSSTVVSREFRDLCDWMRLDPAAREKPPMLTTARAVRPPMKHQPSRQRRRAQVRAARKRDAA